MIKRMFFLSNNGVMRILNAKRQHAIQNKIEQLMHSKLLSVTVFKEKIQMQTELPYSNFTQIQTYFDYHDLDCKCFLAIISKLNQ